jgi:transposase-like protein
MSGKKRKNYTPEYRREAAHLVIDTGRPIATVAREIGVGEQLLVDGWRSNGRGLMTRRAGWM